MSGNSFGTLFKIMTWGESHGEAVGVVIDGCPAGIELTVEEVNEALKTRAPGQSPLTSPRKEPDEAHILSGVFEGKTTGTPISILIPNHDVDSTKYEPLKNVFRPGHANFTYLKKYGIFDYRGGGRSSARETVCRVAAGSVAKKLLARFGIEPRATLVEVGGVKDYEKRLLEAIASGDSLGGIVEVTVPFMLVGLGEPVYRKLEALLAQAMLSLPASKGFEMGMGFQAARMCGSEHNDPFMPGDVTLTNHAGGTLGGIATGMPLHFRVAFKPTSSIGQMQKTTTLEGEPTEYTLPKGSKHDPCVAIRAVPVVEAMTALVLADLVLSNRCSKIDC